MLFGLNSSLFAVLFALGIALERVDHDGDAQSLVQVVEQAQNGFGGNTVTTYMFDANLNYFLKMDNYKETKGNMNADLVTQAVHEKLGY